MLDLNQLRMGAPVGDQGLVLCIEIGCESRERIGHGTRPNHNPLLVVSNGGEARVAVQKETLEQAILPECGVLKLIEKNKWVCGLQTGGQARIV